MNTGTDGVGSVMGRTGSQLNRNAGTASEVGDR